MVVAPVCYGITQLPIDQIPENYRGVLEICVTKLCHDANDMMICNSFEHLPWDVMIYKPFQYKIMPFSLNIMFSLPYNSLCIQMKRENYSFIKQTIPQ